jgi:hypothetical protein
VLIMERVELWCLMPLSIIFNNGFRLFKVLYSKKDMKLVFSRFISKYVSFSDTVKLLFLICRLDNHFCSMNISDIVIFHKYDIVALLSLTYLRHNFHSTAI